MNNRIALVLLALLMAACAPSEQVVATAAGATLAAYTPLPTQTPYPTYTPRPTYTALPTYTPAPTYTPRPTVAVRVEVTKIVQKLVTATAPPDFTLLYTFTGRGKSSTDLFTLSTGSIRVKWKYTGSSNFAFYIKRLDNDAEVLMENTIGSSEGQQLLNVGSSTKYFFDVKFAQGDWTITVEYMP